MQRYFLKRLIGSAIAILGAATIVFFLIRVSGDPVRLMLPVEATAADVASLRTAMGFDRPLYIQYGNYLLKLLQGDLGASLRYGQPALELVLERIPVTLELAVAATALASLVGIVSGIITAVYRNSFVDAVVSFLVLLAQSIPGFWLSIVLILIFSVKLLLFPTSGNVGWDSLVLPALSLAAYPAATITRLMRASLLSVLKEDYIRTARAKGFSMWNVIIRQALRNACVPVVTQIGLEFGSLLGGAVVTETIFAWPGIGRLMIEAVNNRDFPLVQACVLLISFMFVFLNFLVDMSYFLIDPRIKCK